MFGSYFGDVSKRRERPDGRLSTVRETRKQSHIFISAACKYEVWCVGVEHLIQSVDWLPIFSLFFGWPSVVWGSYSHPRASVLKSNDQNYLFTSFMKPASSTRTWSAEGTSPKEVRLVHRRGRIRCRNHIWPFLYKWYVMSSLSSGYWWWQRTRSFWKILNLGFISLSVQQTPWNLIIRISFIRFIRGK